MTDSAERATASLPDLEALLCALILAPDTYARNRFFELFQSPAAQRVRRRARRVRSMIKELTEPWPLEDGGEARFPRAVLLSQEGTDGGMVRVRYRMSDLEYERTTTLEPLEAAAFRYALARAGRGTSSEDDKRRVETALGRLCGDLGAA
jgi:hypothetical protein